MKLWHRFESKIRKKLGLQSNLQRLETRRVAFLRKNKASDLVRWSKQEELQESWNERTAILGDAVENNARVIEFGAANLFLKDYLSDTVQYTGADIIARHENMLVCDLNIRPISINLQSYDTAVLSGVLEYIYDIDYLFEAFQKAGVQRLLFSYACADFCKQNRHHNGWLNDFKKVEIETLLKNAGYLIEEIRTWKGQHVFISCLK
jgi:hypothetical protein